MSSASQYDEDHDFAVFGASKSRAGRSARNHNRALTSKQAARIAEVKAVRRAKAAAAKVRAVARLNVATHDWPHEPTITVEVVVSADRAADGMLTRESANRAWRAACNPNHAAAAAAADAARFGSARACARACDIADEDADASSSAESDTNEAGDDDENESGTTAGLNLTGMRAGDSRRLVASSVACAYTLLRAPCADRGTSALVRLSFADVAGPAPRTGSIDVDLADWDLPAGKRSAPAPPLTAEEHYRAAVRTGRAQARQRAAASRRESDAAVTTTANGISFADDSWRAVPGGNLHSGDVSAHRLKNSWRLLQQFQLDLSKARVAGNYHARHEGHADLPYASMFYWCALADRLRYHYQKQQHRQRTAERERATAGGKDRAVQVNSCYAHHKVGPAE